MCVYVLKELKRTLTEHPDKRELHVMLNPNLLNYLLKENEEHIKTIERRYRTKISFTIEPGAHVEEVKIV